MHVQVKVITTVSDNAGWEMTRVESAEQVSIGDNQRLLREAIAKTGIYDKVASLNLDQVEGRFSRG